MQTLFLDKSPQGGPYTPLLSYMHNVALGNEKTYNRIDVGATYVQPVWSEMSWTLGLSYYNMVYPYAAASTAERKDNDFSLTTGLSKPIRDWVIWGVNGTYTKNDSTVTTYAYDKVCHYDDGDVLN